VKKISAVVGTHVMYKGNNNELKMMIFCPFASDYKPPGGTNFGLLILRRSLFATVF